MKHLEIVLAMCLALALILPPGCATQNRGYTSTAYIGVSPPAHRGHSTRDRNIAVDLDTLKGSYMKLAKGDSVLRRAINEDNTEDGTKRDRIRKTSWFTGDLAGTISLLQEKLSVASVKDTNLIRISLSGPNANELPEVVNAVADALVHLVAEQPKQRRADQMTKLNDRLGETLEQISANQKEIDQIRGKSEVSFMHENRTTLQLNLQSLTTELTQLRLVKAQAQAACDTLKKQAKSGELAKSPKITQALEKDPTYRKLLAAVENMQIELDSLSQRLGPHLNLDALEARLKKVEKVRAEMETELVAKHIKTMMKQQESQVTAVSERIQAVGNQHKELSRKLGDLGARLSRIGKLEAGIENMQENARLIEAALPQFRIALDYLPLSIQAYAEVPTKRSP